ncbi:MAG: DUF4255 domain-containing protein [Cyanobacteriota bacterium]|nr:DUF4255 domain-containing protein [Cyanobacteriota bacterium]
MSLASIAGTSDTLVSLLRQRLEDRLGPGRDGFEVELFRSADFTGSPRNKVSLLLYRVDVDEARRLGRTPAAPPLQPAVEWLGVELSYLLTVWGNTSAIGEHRMLQHCMEILQEFAIVSGPWLSAGYSWEPEDALRISLASLNHEDMMRLWDGFDLPYQLSTSYLVRTVRLGARSREEAPATSRSLLVGNRSLP